MRIIVFSDSHGNALVLPEIFKRHPEAEAFLFLGDGEREFSALRETNPQKLIRGVRGNCDWNSPLPLTDMIAINRKRIFFTHGHYYYVKRSLADLMDEARNNKADIVLFGHTHVAMCDYADGVHILNPGSVAQPRNGRASYGYVDITDAGIFTGVAMV